MVTVLRAFGICPWADIWMIPELGADVSILRATIRFSVLFGFVPEYEALVLSVATYRLVSRRTGRVANLRDKLRQLLRIIGGWEACPCRAHERLRSLGVELWQNLPQGGR